MLVATPSELAIMECHNYECEKQYSKGRCINVCHAVNCQEKISRNVYEHMKTRKSEMEEQNANS